MTRTVEVTVEQAVEMREAGWVLEEVAEGLGVLRFLIGPLGCVDDPKTREMLAGVARLMVNIGDRVAPAAGVRDAKAWLRNRGYQDALSGVSETHRTTEPVDGPVKE